MNHTLSYIFSTLLISRSISFYGMSSESEIFMDLTIRIIGLITSLIPHSLHGEQQLFGFYYTGYASQKTLAYNHCEDSIRLRRRLFVTPKAYFLFISDVTSNYFVERIYLGIPRFLQNNTSALVGTFPPAGGPKTLVPAQYYITIIHYSCRATCSLQYITRSYTFFITARHFRSYFLIYFIIFTSSSVH